MEIVEEFQRFMPNLWDALDVSGYTYVLWRVRRALERGTIPRDEVTPNILEVMKLSAPETYRLYREMAGTADRLWEARHLRKLKTDPAYAAAWAAKEKKRNKARAARDRASQQRRAAADPAFAAQVAERKRAAALKYATKKRAERDARDPEGAARRAALAARRAELATMTPEEVAARKDEEAKARKRRWYEKQCGAERGGRADGPV